MKGYQISQFEEPIAQYGKLAIDNPPDREKEIRITRVHLEEDVAKLKHSKDTSGDGYSLLDINRSGVALMEIVSEPDIRSSKEAHSYLTNLHSLLRFIEVSTANMEEGSFRCDANISIRPLRSNKAWNLGIESYKKPEAGQMTEGLLSAKELKSMPLTIDTSPNQTCHQ